MLNVIGVASIDDLFAPVPESLRLNALNLPPGISEMEAVAFVQSLTNREREASPSFWAEVLTIIFRQVSSMR